MKNGDKLAPKKSKDPGDDQGILRPDRSRIDAVRLRHRVVEAFTYQQQQICKYITSSVQSQKGVKSCVEFNELTSFWFERLDICLLFLF